MKTEIKFTPEDWISWATDNGYHPLAIEAFRDHGFNGRQAEIINNILKHMPELHLAIDQPYMDEEGYICMGIPDDLAAELKQSEPLNP